MTRKERTAFLLENGFCTTCGKMKAAEGRNSCINCLDNFKVIYERRKEKRKLAYQQNAEAIKEQNKAKYYYYREHGLCTRCGKKAVEGLSTCQKCRRIKKGV